MRELHQQTPEEAHALVFASKANANRRGALNGIGTS